MSKKNQIKKNPLVSICIPVYNGADFVTKALESAVSQSYGNLEIVICDDASADKTLKIAESYQKKHSQVKVFKNKKNLGLAKNFLKTYSLATGDFIQHLAQDDWLDKNFIEERVKIFKEYPEAAFVAGPIKSYQKERGLMKATRIVNKKPGIYLKKYIYKNFYKQDGLIGLFCTARKSELVNSFLINIPNKFGYDEFYKKGVVIDNLVFLNILSSYNFIYYAEKGIMHTLSHSQNASKSYGFKQSLSDEVKFMHIKRIGFEYFFQNRAPHFLSPYRIFEGANLFASLFFSFVFKGKRNFSKGEFKKYFFEYCFWEKLTSFLYFPVILINRTLKWLVHKTKNERE